MATKEKREASGETASAAEDKSANEKEFRTHEIGGIPYPVVKSVYDPVQNCVLDYVERTKIVQNRRGEDVEVKIIRKTYCDDEEIQEKYRQNRTAVQEVN